MRFLPLNISFWKYISVVSHILAMSLCVSECHKVVEKYLGCNDFEIREFYFKTAGDASMGLIAASYRLFITVVVSGKVKDLRFFYKTLPSNPYHLKMVNESHCFSKEAWFYSKIQNNLRRFQNNTIMPECYYADESHVILADLSLIGYKNLPVTETFDLEHCKVAIKSLSDLHASSLLYEKKSGLTIDKQNPDMMFVNWYSPNKDHLGHAHVMTGKRALKAVMDNYFTHFPLDIRNKVVSLWGNLPWLLSPSTKHKNCVSHCDLWNNNVMFKYENDKVKNACIIDFQLFLYNPPALDLITLIFLNTDEQLRQEHLPYLIKYYYDSLSNNIKRNEENPKELFPYEEFVASIEDILPMALALSTIYLHYTLLPEEKLMEMITDNEKIVTFMEKDRSSLVLDAIETSAIYKSRLFSVIDEMINCVMKNFSLSSKVLTIS